MLTGAARAAGAALVAGLLVLSRRDVSTVLLLVVLAVVFATLAVVGPWVVALLGRLVVATSASTASLLAGRRLLDDPRGVWRTVGVVAMTGFGARPWSKAAPPASTS